MINNKRKFKKRSEKSYTITVIENYHTLKVGIEYPVIQEGIDWYLVRSRGKAVYVFKSLVEC
jgi:hypothetical protein